MLCFVVITVMSLREREREREREEFRVLGFNKGREVTCGH